LGGELKDDRKGQQTAFDLRTAEIENARKIQREIKPAAECRAE